MLQGREYQLADPRPREQELMRTASYDALAARAQDCRVAFISPQGQSDCHPAAADPVAYTAHIDRPGTGRAMEFGKIMVFLLFVRYDHRYCGHTSG